MTQHHHAPPPDPMPLDPEERALAARLARLGPHGEPSPALDARVLAAAHAAHTAATARAVRERGWRRARWPVGVGVAASVVLAAGIAWQMRPLPAPQFTAGAPAESGAAMTAARDRAEATAAPEDASTPALARVASVPPSREVAAATAPVEGNAPATAGTARDAVAAKALATPTPTPSPEPPVVFDAPSPADVAAPPPAPPAPPAPVAQARQGAATRAANDAAQAPAQATQAVSDAGDMDAPEGDVPPATAASPQVRDAWLARIRELAAAGLADEARASLAEFHRRYPAFAIPADLRPLLPPASPASAPTPATTPPR